MSKASLKKSAASFGPLKFVLVVGVLFLPLLFLVLQCFQKEAMTDVVDAQRLYKGIGTVTETQSESENLDGILDAAGNVFKAKNLNARYKANMDMLREKLASLKTDMLKFESTHTFFTQANVTLDNIDKVAVKIFADDWSVSQMTRYVRSVKKNQADFKAILSEAAAEMDSLLAEKFEIIEGKNSKGTPPGLLWMLSLAVIIAGLNFLFYRRMKALLP